MISGRFLLRSCWVLISSWYVLAGSGWFANFKKCNTSCDKCSLVYRKLSYATSERNQRKNKIFTFFGARLIEMQYFPLMKWWKFSLKSLIESLISHMIEISFEYPMLDRVLILANCGSALIVWCRLEKITQQRACVSTLALRLQHIYYSEFIRSQGTKKNICSFNKLKITAFN